MDLMAANLPEMEKRISSFIKITSSSTEVAISLLETHQWNLTAAVRTFHENPIATAKPNVPNPSHEHLLRHYRPPTNLRIIIPPHKSDAKLDQNNGGEDNRDIARPEQSSKSVSVRRPTYGEPDCLYTVTRWRNVSTIIESPFTALDDARAANVLEIMSRLKLPIDFGLTHIHVKVIRREQEYFFSAELQEQQQQEQPYGVITLIVTIWTNGFTVGDSWLMSLDDPNNASILEMFRRAESSGPLPARLQVNFSWTLAESETS